MSKELFARYKQIRMLKAQILTKHNQLIFKKIKLPRTFPDPE